MVTGLQCHYQLGVIYQATGTGNLRRRPPIVQQARVFDRFNVIVTDQVVTYLTSIGGAPS